MKLNYSYDDAGNASGVTDATGTSIYSANNINQYTQRTVPGAVSVSGSAVQGSNVAIQRVSLGDTATAFTHFMNINKYFSKVYSIDNSTSSVEEQFKVFASKFDTTNNRDVVDEKILDIFVPQTPEAYTYDADGNQLSDGRYTYTYNAENRLISATRTGIEKTEFTYDYRGRRIEKKTYSWVSSAWQLDTQLKFVYDGYKVIGVLDGLDSDALKQSILWQGATPLSIYDAELDETYYYLVDGNKNVIGLVDENGVVVAKYEYSPFGKIIQQSGFYADKNPLRFSSEYFDSETGLIYYNYRYYNPETSRWLNRDPIMEAGGYNLYAMVSNDPINTTDYLGLLKCTWLGCGDGCRNEGDIVIIKIYPTYAPANSKGSPKATQDLKDAVDNINFLELAKDVIDIGKAGVNAGKVAVEFAQQQTSGKSGTNAKGSLSEAIMSTMDSLSRRLMKQRGVIIWIYVKWKKCIKKTCWCHGCEDYLDWKVYDKEYKHTSGNQGHFTDGYAYGDTKGLSKGTIDATKIAIDSIK